MSRSIVCVGEVLWDAMPAGLFLGGAPCNVACHLQRLGQPVDVVSRVGDDALGREAVRRLEARGLHTAFVQVDRDLPSGFVSVRVDEDGVADYEIVEPVAWDAIALDDGLRERVAGARAVVFGSLAQRREPSRETVQTLCSLGALAVFDVNLRPPHVSREVVRASLVAADIVKVNEEELRQLGTWFGGPRPMRAAVAVLAEAFGCRLVCVTRGGDGAVLWHEGRWAEHPGYPVVVADTVGAGDAFLAALLAAVLEGRGDDEALGLACRLGAFVASQPGAVPAYEASGLADLAALPL